jgi:hypothetical protein
MFIWEISMRYLSYSALGLTKAGFDAGESFYDILARKEMERVCGKGIFWWGVGEHKGAAIERLVSDFGQRALLFNFPNNPAARPDRTGKGEYGEQALVWRKFYDSRTRRYEELPPHVLVTSGAATQNGRQKTSYNALICHSDLPLKYQKPIGLLKESTYRCIKQGALGSYRHGSQTTLALVSDPSTIPVDSAPDFPVHFEAHFADPNFVSLGDPKLIPKSEVAELNRLIRTGCGPEDWLNAIRRLRF